MAARQRSNRIGLLTILGPSLTMPKASGVARLDEISLKWRALADRRLAYFTELYCSGRWKHYYTTQDFAVRMRDVIRAAKLWRDLADRTLAQRVRADQRTAREQRLRRAA
jgi:uncharacterized repeat protein (TIGR03809 family)